MYCVYVWICMFLKVKGQLRKVCSVLPCGFMGLAFTRDVGWYKVTPQIMHFKITPIM